MKTLCTLLVTGCLILGTMDAPAADFDHAHARWDGLLKRHVSWIGGGVARYLRDRTRNRNDAASRTLEVGKIFDWYAEDFEKGYRGITSLKQFFARHAKDLATAPDDRKIIQEQRAGLSFSPYDWRLNARW